MKPQMNADKRRFKQDLQHNIFLLSASIRVYLRFHFSFFVADFSHFANQNRTLPKNLCENASETAQKANFKSVI
jgi:hypothetical protein